MHDALSRMLRGGRFVSFTNNLDAVSTFKSFPASHKYHILLFVVELVPTSVNYLVFRISADRNTVADYLSRNRIQEVLHCVPNPPFQTMVL